MDEIKVICVEDYLSPVFPDMRIQRSGEEKEAILKEFGFEKGENGKYKFFHNTFSRAFKKYVVVKLLSNQEELAIYNFTKGVYELNCEEIIHKVIKHCMNLFFDLWNPGFASTAFKTIRHDTCDVVENFNSANHICLKNGILDLETYQIYVHSPRFLSTLQLPFEYTDEMPTPVFDKFLDDITCGDEDMKLVIQEIFGYCICNSNASEKFFYFEGQGRNGKSLTAKLIQKLVGEGNYSTASLSSLSTNFGLEPLIHVQVNIAAENEANKINSEIVKSIASGDVIQVQRKYKSALNLKLHCKLIFLTNNLPETTDLSMGFMRKVFIVPFRKTIREEEVDVELIDKLERELPGIFRFAIEGLKRLRANKYNFSHCQACEDALEAYKQFLNPVASFFEDNFIKNEASSIRKSEIYLSYVQYCSDNAREALQCQRFWKCLKAHFSDKNYSFKSKKIKGYDYLEGLRLK